MTIEPRTSLDPSAWLAAAVNGGLPEPGSQRWQPLRVGIVSMWEYDNVEFWFADGRMVLRGGNGAGKTKVLELTTLMLLRGEIQPSDLDPFGSQHRTMKFNLLPTGDGDDPREPADSGLGYAWVEFGMLDEDGQPSYFTCGLGASARRGTGITRPEVWHFHTALRHGKDFSLISGGHALAGKELRTLDGIETPPNAKLYRAAVAETLFGLDSESYEHLTDLLKQLRRPKLGERLNPSSLAETLRDALPPVAGHEISQLAKGWDQLQQLRATVEVTERAAADVAGFVRNGWRPWARAVVRRHADDLAAAITQLDNTTKDKRAAESEVADAQGRVAQTHQHLEEATTTAAERQTELGELLESNAYRDAAAAAQRVERLRDSVTSLTTQTERARRHQTAAEATAAQAQRQVEAATAKAHQASEAVETAARNAGTAAAPAGLTASAERHLPGRDVTVLLADCQARSERLEHLRDLQLAFDNADRRAENSAREVETRETDLSDAEQAQQAAEHAAQGTVDVFRERLRAWAAEATIVACTTDQVDSWCDMVAELTHIDEVTTTVVAGVSVIDAVRAHCADVRHRLDSASGQVKLRRAPLAERLRDVAADLEAIEALTEQPPPSPALWRRRDRPEPDEEGGAPLWRCVQPAPGVPDETLDRLEATLAAAGLLDAWLEPGGGISGTVGGLDTWISSATPAQTSLLEVLEPASAGGVSTGVIRAMLDGIGWLGPGQQPPEGPWMSYDGRWRVGQLAGRTEPVGPASYLGAAARESARRRKILALQQELSGLRAKIKDCDSELTSLADRMSLVRAEERAVPGDAERDVTTAVAVLAERMGRRRGYEQRLTTAREAHRMDLATRDQRWADFAGYAGAHGLPLRDLAAVAVALDRYRQTLQELRQQLELFALHEDALRVAAERHHEDSERAVAAAEDVAALESELRGQQIRLRTAEQALGAEHKDQLDRKAHLETQLSSLTASAEQLRGELREADIAVAKAEAILNTHEDRRQQAEQNRDATLARWWQVIDAGLADPVGIHTPVRRVVETARDSARQARRELPETNPDTVDRLWRRCHAQLQELRQRLLPDRDARVDDEGSLPVVTVLADTTAGWQTPVNASDALAMRVAEQRDKYDAEQQRVLTTLLGSTFIEHLKDRLDYTERTFTRINTTLATHPTRQGHAVRLVWEPDPREPDARAVVAALGQGYQQLSEDRQEMVRSFLARKIDEARDEAAAEGAADWDQQLGAALDYRRWLRISLEYRPGAGGRWAGFDSAKHGAKSGGEKVVLLSQPLFAAAVVAYDAAAPYAPRWVWLDEAMTGVDAKVKASFMGLTVSFALDVMLTAHDEWCNYDTVPAVAVYDLARTPHLPGVDVVPYLWCGSMHRLGVERLGFAPPSEVIAADDLLAHLEEE